MSVTIRDAKTDFLMMGLDKDAYLNYLDYASKAIDAMRGENFSNQYPVGTRIQWCKRGLKRRHWYPGVVVEAERETDFDPTVWFLLDKDKEGETRFISHTFQEHIRHEVNRN